MIRRFGISCHSHPQNFVFWNLRMGSKRYPETSYHPCSITTRYNPKALQHQLASFVYIVVKYVYCKLTLFRLEYIMYIKMLLATWLLIMKYCWCNIFLNSIRVFSQYLTINIWQNLFYYLWIFAHFVIAYFKAFLKAMAVEHCLFRLFWKVTTSDRYLPLYTFLYV